ncbi:hypothetical protein BV22DRAFT_1033670 [Leucogyrophana mollusca]|uniref:Uncharacterized protein n=1 Tax=Leucogyrophana mollusca TaxID=85980 RepID=A0ACB8BMG3_9AGAM|nr:hypothetical protein BV22DRAFT_1033670 [Leucogyrophana mollusca]
MAPFSKPETVLKQAEGLVSVGQTHAALQSLTEMFQSKRFRSTPLAALEPIMLRFVELCVDMRKGRTAKEGLMQYKNIAQNTSVASIEAVVSRFLQLSDAKVQAAQGEADKAVVALTADVDDLEAIETPESILLGAVSGDQSRDRTDRALVTPWLKFLWESYRTSLETLKNNARLEAIYQQVAQQAFRFCLKHQRKVEFRRLCETLRLHLSNVAKYSHQPHAINLSDADTLQHHLDTRFAQLNTSVELELWQEAFRSVEDVHNLLTLAKKAPRPAMMANYYEKLTKIFLMSGNALYHAAAWGRYYAVVTGIGGKDEEELRRLAGQVLVSALAVPVGAQVEEEENKSKSGRLAALLGLTKPPTRAGLLKDALARDVLRLAPAPIRSLYTLLEASFDPLNLCASTAPILASLSDPSPDSSLASASAPASASSPSTATASASPYAPYRPLLARALLSRVLAQLAQVYSTLSVSALRALVAPAGLEDDVEAYVVRCRGLGVRVDHAAGVVRFCGDVFGGEEGVAGGAAGTSASAGTGASASAGAGAGNSAVQPSGAELVRTRLSTLATTLHNSLNVLYPPASPSLSPAEEQQAKFTALVGAANAERHALQVRRALVARRRELLAELSVRKEKEEASRRAESSRRERDEEAKRAKADAARKELERARKEIESIRTEEAKKLAQNLIKRGGLKVSVNEMEDLSTDSLMRLQVEQLEKEKKELNERLRIASKRIDHTERAYRKEELPLLASDYATQQATDRTTFAALQRARVDGARAAFAADVETKRRLARMTGDFEARREAIAARRGEEYERKVALAREKIEAEKAERRAGVLRAREEKRLAQEEEDRRRREREEEEARLEAERIAAEEAEALKKQEEEAKLAEIRRQREQERAEAAEKARLQAIREEEAVKRAEERRNASRTAPPAAAAPVLAADAKWRRTSPANTTPSTPSRPPVAVTPPRAESPAPAAAAPAKYRPGALGGGGGGGGWREREQAKKAGVVPPPRSSSPAVGNPPAREEPKKEDDGFQTVPEKKVWRPSRLQGRT